MGREVAIGIQNYDEIIENNYFYVDKTHFIKEWWDSGDSVTQITRPRRFGKTLTMSMVEQFFQWSMQTEKTCLRACQSGERQNTVSFRGLIRLSVFPLPV